MEELDQLIVGPFTFDGFSPPEQMPAGGEARLHQHELLGGALVTDMLGSRPGERQWQGFFFHARAVEWCSLLASLRIAAQPLPFSWGTEVRTVVIKQFLWKIEKFNYVHYDITLKIVDNNEATLAGQDSPDSTVGDDMSSASDAGSSSDAAQGG